MIKLKNVSKSYGNGVEAIKNINLDIAPGEMAFITGHSGAGKSTLLKLMTCQIRPDSGEVLIQNKAINRLKGNKIAKYRRRIGMIFQDPHLIQDQSIFDNVALPLLITGCHPREIPRRVHAALDKVGMLDKEHSRPAELSSGEQQRVGIARAIVNKPAIVLADEPTGNLDPGLSLDVVRLLYEFNKVGVTVLIATHDISLLDEIPVRQIVIREGRIYHDTAKETQPCT